MPSTHGPTPRPMVHSFEQVYAGALLDLAEEALQTDAIADEVAQLIALAEADPSLAQLLASKMLSAEERAGVLERVFKGRISDLLYRFLTVVNRKERLDGLPGILRAFQQGLEERRGVVEVDAFVATALSDQQTGDVAGRIGAALNRRVVLHQYVDDALIGGLKIRVGDEIIDGSVATQLKLMREGLIEAGRERARAAGL